MLKEITRILYEEDPVKLKSPYNDEYDSEARLFLNWIKSNKYEDILDILHQVFISQFNYGEDDDGDISYHNFIGDKSNFESSAKRIHKLLNGDAQ